MTLFPLGELLSSHLQNSPAGSDLSVLQPLDWLGQCAIPTLHDEWAVHSGDLHDASSGCWAVDQLTLAYPSLGAEGDGRRLPV